MTTNDYTQEDVELYYKNDIDKMQKDMAKESNSSLLMSLLSKLSKGTEVIKIQVPIFMIKPISFLEACGDYGHPFNFALNCSQQKDPADRMLGIIKQLLAVSMLSPQTSFSWCKPYNPVLGEVFKCKFDHNDSTTHFIAEQISHHPPITAIHMKNDKHNYLYTGSILLGGKFYGNSADNIFSGEHIIQLLDIKESYKFTFPNVTACGIVVGKGRLETSGELTVKCPETGYSAQIKFSGSNYGEGRVLNPKGEKIYKIYGNLDKKMILKDYSTKKETIFLEYSILKTRSPKIMIPLDKQESNESRRVWHSVTKNLINKQIDKADKEKKAIEQSQRDLVKKRDQEKEKHVPKYFKPAGYEVNGAPVYEYIGVQEEIETEENVIDIDLD
eukprot:gene6341-10348_t